MLSPPRALVFNVVISPMSLFAALSLSPLFSFFRAIDLRTLPRFCPHLVRTVSDCISKLAGNDEFKRNDFEKAALLYDKVAALIGSSFIDASSLTSLLDCTGQTNSHPTHAPCPFQAYKLAKPLLTVPETIIGENPTQLCSACLTNRAVALKNLGASPSPTASPTPFPLPRHVYLCQDIDGRAPLAAAAAGGGRGA